MIDLLFAREHPERFAQLLRKKDPQFPAEKMLALDVQVRELGAEVDALRSEKNDLARAARSGITDAIREKSIAVGARLKEREEYLRVLEREFNDIYLRCPNVPLDELPEGGKEANKEVRSFGKKPEFSFTPKNHVALLEGLDWVDFDAAARMAGSHFVLYKKEGVQLLYSLAMYMLMHNTKQGYTPVLPPCVVNEHTLEGASNFPRFKEEVYAIEKDGLYLTPTSEVNLANLYRDRIFAREELPIRMTSWTSCFRREAGGYGATERGLIRIHQFEKVELFTLCEPENTAAEQEKMLATAEAILQALGLHYRVMLLAAQDCSFASAKTYDIEVWMPGQGEYKEVSSISMCTDFQARRCGIRYRPQPKDKTHLVHTLNASSLALPRLMVALLETYQQADGSVALPAFLRSITWAW